MLVVSFYSKACLSRINRLGSILLPHLGEENNNAGGRMCVAGFH